jgi:hypothetical protein
VLTRFTEEARDRCGRVADSGPSGVELFLGSERYCTKMREPMIVMAVQPVHHELLFTKKAGGTRL